MRKPPENSQPGKLTRLGIESGPAWWEATMLLLDHSGGPRIHNREPKYRNFSRIYDILNSFADIRSALEFTMYCTCTPITMCVPMPTHCTITYFGFHAWWIDGVKCDLFLNHAPLGQTTLCVGWRWKEGKRWNPVPAHSVLFSKSTEGAARLNVPIRRTNCYQQYYMPSQHTYCGRVWNLIQAWCTI